MKKVGFDECPNCGSDIVIYKAWTTFEENNIDILPGAKWRCPDCDKTGKLDKDLLVD
ncbi:hypothetical protein KGY79_13030 [Candidatus Bipolaricaulota bacterium]|nr:hypothetical protein [Candidatus Bipolaricaulota bacterium]